MEGQKLELFVVVSERRSSGRDQSRNSSIEMSEQGTRLTCMQSHTTAMLSCNSADAMILPRR